MSDSDYPYEDCDASPADLAATEAYYARTDELRRLFDARECHTRTPASASAIRTWFCAARRLRPSALPMTRPGGTMDPGCRRGSTVRWIARRMAVTLGFI